MNLNDIKNGEMCRIVRIEPDCPNRLRLLEMGLIPGTAVRRGRTSPFSDPVEIELRNYSLTIRKKEAAAVTVAEIND